MSNDTTDGASLPRNVVRQDGQKRALEAFATAYIFEFRASKLKKKLKNLSFVGLAIPVVIGALALSYGANFTALPILIIVGSAVGVVQVIFSLWSLNSQWVESYAFAIDSTIANKSLSTRFAELCRNPPSDDSTFFARMDLLKVEDDARRQQDYKATVSEKEKHRGMRAALRQFGKKCANCDQIPTGMTPTKCEVCGDF